MPRYQPAPPPPIPEPARKWFTDPYEWRDFTEGTWDEWRVCNFMRANVITAEEKGTMAYMGLTLEDMVNGRYGDAEQERVAKLYEAWNARLGYKMYSSY